MNFDRIIYEISMGSGDPHCENLIKVIMSADDREYARLSKMYPDLMEAIDRFNRANKFMVDVRFVRGKGK